MPYPKHSRFVYADYDDIERAINEGELNEFDICIAQDTRELLLIKDDLELLPINSKIYRYTSISEAEAALNAASDTYEGQLVAILSNGKYVAYIVNRRNDHFAIDSLATVNMVIDYDEISHTPIINKYGNIGAPIMLSELPDGAYKVTGQYRIAESLVTTFSSASGNLFSVSHNVDFTTIKKITSSEITDYYIDAEGNVSVSRYVTNQYLADNHYTTTEYVDAKIAALDFITREEMNAYVFDIVQQSIDAIIDARIDAAIDAKTVVATEEEIRQIFD